MAQMVIRGIDEEVMAALKSRAARNGRSMEKEARGILSGAVMAGTRNRDVAPQFQAMQKELLKKRKGKIFSDSTALIREDRASRD